MRDAISQVETEMVATLPPLDDNLEEVYASGPGSSDEADVQLKVIHTKTTRPDKPLILLFHGGGFCAGSNEMLTRPGREFAQEFDAVVVLASCRKTPEHCFPTPMLDGWYVAYWLSQRQNAFGADPECGLLSAATPQVGSLRQS